MSGPTCDEVSGQIELYAAGECDPQTADAVARHIAACPSCAADYAEAKEMLGLLDLRLGEPERLGRLLDRIGEEAEPRPALRVVPAASRRKLRPAVRWRAVAVAASVLLAVGLWAFPDLPAPSPAGEEPRLVASLDFRPVRGGPEQFAPAGKEIKVARTGGPNRVKRIEVLPLDLAGEKPAAFRARLLASAGTKELPPAPAVGLVLSIRNAGAAPWLLRFDDERTELRLDVRGLAVLRVPASPTADPPFPATAVPLEPGASFELPIPRLVEGSRGSARNLYWTEPGDYVVRARLRVVIRRDEGKPGVAETIVTEPRTIRVVGRSR